MSCLKQLVAAVAVATFAVPSLAQSQTYELDDTHTYATFSWNHFGLSTQSARFNTLHGTVTIDREARSGEVDIVIDMDSVDTGYATFDEHIKDADFFDVEQHPQATFRGSSVRFEDGTPVAVSGELTIKGISHEVTLDITSFAAMPHPMLENTDAIGANATVEVLRSDFDAGKYAPHVSDEVRIDIALEAVRPH